MVKSSGIKSKSGQFGSETSAIYIEAKNKMSTIELIKDGEFEVLFLIFLIWQSALEADSRMRSRDLIPYSAPIFKLHIKLCNLPRVNTYFNFKGYLSYYLSCATSGIA